MGLGAFVIGLSQISSSFSYFKSHVHDLSLRYYTVIELYRAGPKEN